VVPPVGSWPSHSSRMHQATAMPESAGTSTVTDALMTLFGPITLAILGLVTSRDELRARAAPDPGRRVSRASPTPTVTGSRGYPPTGSVRPPAEQRRGQAPPTGERYNRKVD
jgi:hypothetical protein